jgi:membrane protein implicated in regulation of membrane protease activity
VIGTFLVLCCCAAALLRRWLHRREADREQRQLTRSFNRAKSQG